MIGHQRKSEQAKGFFSMSSVEREQIVPIISVVYENALSIIPSECEVIDAAFNPLSRWA